MSKPTIADVELVTSAGIAMAGSFDIREILRETHAAASRILSGAPVSVLYAGRLSINARPLWFPAEPVMGGVDEADRRRVERSLDSVLATEAVAGRRSVVPLRQDDELLGALFFTSPRRPGEGSLRLLDLLTRHAAIALRNIHLTQERILFERLSAVGRMIGTVVHDLKSPLTALRGYASMLSKLELGEGERREYAGWMLEECDRLDRLVSELLEFTRGGRRELSPEWTDLAGYLAAFAERLARHNRERGIEIRVEESHPGSVRIDRARLERALSNVATNACQAMPGGGLLKLRSREENGRVVLEIEDEGPGIPEGIRHRVFEPFFSHGKSQGIGLGMATTRSIVEEHGGEVAIESSPGKGTLVRIFLPVGGPDPDPLASTAAESATRAG